MTRTTGLMFVALLAAMLVVAAVGCASCQLPPGPSPGTGGTVSTGGAPGTGGLDATGGAPPATGGAFATGGTLPGTGGAPEPLDDCGRAEARLRELRCKRDDGGPRWLTPAGTPLAIVCRAREADGDSICPACLAKVASCAGIGACRARKPGVCP